MADAGGGRGRTLVAGGGFFGPPQEGSVENSVEVGCSVLPEFQRRGYATEMAMGPTEWALAQPSVRRVVANVASDNTPSLRLLRRIGFSEIGDTPHGLKTKS